jgi:hypothetical protein
MEEELESDAAQAIPEEPEHEVALPFQRWGSKELVAGTVPVPNEVHVSSRYAELLRETGADELLKEDRPLKELCALVTYPEGSPTYRALCGESLAEEDRGTVEHVIADLRKLLNAATARNMIAESAYVDERISELKALPRATVESREVALAAVKVAKAEQVAQDRAQ